MFLEVVNIVTKQLFTGKDGFTILAPRGVIISALKTAENEYIVEKEVYYTQKLVVQGIYNEDEAIKVVKDLLPQECLDTLPNLAFKGYARIKTQSFKQEINLHKIKLEGYL